MQNFEGDSFNYFLKSCSNKDNKVVKKQMREALEVHQGLLNKLDERENINSDVYLNLLETRNSSDLIGKKEFGELCAQLGLQLTDSEKDAFFQDLNPNDDGKIKLGALLGKIKVSNQEEIEQKQKELRMKKKFVTDVKSLLAKRNLRYEEYFTLFLSRGEILVDKFAQQLMDIKYDLEKNNDTYLQIVFELTEETDDISYKKLCDMFNFFEYLNDPNKDLNDNGIDDEDELKEPQPVMKMYEKIRRMAIDKKKTFRELFIVG